MPSIIRVFIQIAIAHLLGTKSMDFIKHSELYTTKCQLFMVVFFFHIYGSKTLFFIRKITVNTFAVKGYLYEYISKMK